MGKKYIKYEVEGSMNPFILEINIDSPLNFETNERICTLEYRYTPEFYVHEIEWKQIKKLLTNN